MMEVPLFSFFPYAHADTIEHGMVQLAVSVLASAFRVRCKSSDIFVEDDRSCAGSRIVSARFLTSHADAFGSEYGDFTNAIEHQFADVLSWAVWRAAHSMGWKSGLLQLSPAVLQVAGLAQWRIQQAMATICCASVQGIRVTLRDLTGIPLLTVQMGQSLGLPEFGSQHIFVGQVQAIASCKFGLRGIRLRERTRLRTLWISGRVDCSDLIGCHVILKARPVRGPARYVIQSAWQPQLPLL